MCLSIDETQTHIEAEEDIVCYKFLDDIEPQVSENMLDSVKTFLRIKRKPDAVYHTPYRKTKVVIGKTYESELVTDGYSIDIGLHSFVRERDAINDMTHMSGAVAVKCIIPKGSIYFTGFFNGIPAYASNCLKYVEIIKHKEK